MSRRALGSPWKGYNKILCSLRPPPSMPVSWEGWDRWCHDAFLAREPCPPSSSIRRQVLHAKGLWGCIVASSHVLCLYAKQLQLKKRESVALQDPSSGVQCLHFCKCKSCVGLFYFKDRCFLHWFRALSCVICVPSLGSSFSLLICIMGKVAPLIHQDSC